MFESSVGCERRKIMYGVLTVLYPMLFAAGSGPAHADASAESGDSGALQEVIVTARRRDESVHDTPVAVTVVNVSQLEAKAAVNIGDLQGSLPNLLITQQNSGAAASNLSMRGLSFADIEKSFDPTVAVVIDGVFLGTSTGSYLDFFDIGSIEVLRGPQGTLFGRNTIGGVINVTRTRPTGQLGGKFEVSYGNFGDVSWRGVFNAPLISDVLAAKLFYFNTRTDGYYRDYLTGRPRGGGKNQNYGAAFLFTPTDSSFDALLTLEKQQQDFEPVNVPLTKTGEKFAAVQLPITVNRNNRGDLYTAFTPPGRATYSAPAATLQLHFDLGNAKMTSITGYRKSDEVQAQDFDGASEALLVPALAPLFYVDRVQDFHQFSEELRGAGKLTDTLDYVVGGYFYNSGYEQTQYTSIFGSGFGNPPQRVSGTARSIAGFADFDWKFADQWRLNFGGRYTQDRKTLLNNFPNLLGNPSATFDKFTPKVSIDYRPTSDLLVYASYSVGERSGGFSNRAATQDATNTAFQPETVDSTEVGVKADFLERRLSANLALFNAKYTHMQQSTTIPGGPTGNQTIVTNVGSATIRGVELELSARPTSELTLTASLGTLNSHFSGFITQAPLNGVLTKYDYSANNLIYAPKITYSLGADYKVPVSFGEVHGNLGFRHIDKYDQQISIGPTTVAPDGTVIVHGNDPRVTAAAQNLLDASLTTVVTSGKFKTHLTLYGRNLTDNLGPTAAFTVAGLWTFASAREPRTYGATLGVDF